MKIKKWDWGLFVALFTLVTLVGSIVYIAVSMAMAPSTAPPGNEHIRVKGDYVLMLSQCILGIIAILLPNILHRTIRLKIPSSMLMLYIIFLYCSIYLGEVRRFYYTVPNWDTILHTFSGAMLGALGFSFINFFNNTDRVPMNLSPLFIAAFSFCFAVTLGVFWEVYEFAADGILNTNMQKFALESGELLMGRTALMDTMKDLIVDIVGALIISIVGYISVKHRKGWVEKLQLKIDRKKE